MMPCMCNREPLFSSSLGEWYCNYTYKCKYYVYYQKRTSFEFYQLVSVVFIFLTVTAIGFDVIFYDLTTGGGYVITKWMVSVGY